MKSRVSLVLASVLLALPLAANASLITFDFEQVPDPLTGGALVSNGFVFDPGNVDWYPEWSYADYTAGSAPWIGHYHIADPSGSWGANNDSRYLVFDYFLDNSWLHIYGDSGQTFGVHQLELAENAVQGVCQGAVPPVFYEQNCGLTFVGHLAGGGVISKYVTLDAITDGAGPLGDFQTFTFDWQWDSLEMFSLLANDQYLNPGLDNLVVSVPEPSTLLLVLGGLGALTFRRRARATPNRQ